VQFGSQGGLITLLNPDGLKVDGVASTQAQADAGEGASSFEHAEAGCGSRHC